MGRRGVLSIVNLGVGSVLGLVALKFMALYFGKEPIGEAVYAIALLGVLFVFSDLSMGEAHVKRVSEGVDVPDCFWTFATYRFVSTTVFAIVGGGAIYLFAVVLDRPLQDTTTAALVFALLYYVVKGFQQVPQSTFEARLEAARAQVISLVETVVRVLVTVVAALAFIAVVYRQGPLVGVIDPDSFVARWVAQNPAGAIVFAYTASVVAATLVALHYLRQQKERGRFRWDILRSYFAFGLPLFALSSIGVISFFIDRLALSFFQSAIDTGAYEAPRRLVSVLEGLGVAVGVLLFPGFSAMLARGDRQGVLTTLDRSVRYLSAITMPIVAFLIVFPVPVIRLTLDDAWVGNALVLSVLAVYVYIATIIRPHVNLLMGSDRPRLAARIGIVGALLNIVLNVLLIPDDIAVLGLDLPGLGALGAALATLASGVVAYFMVVYATYRSDSYRPPAAIGKHALGAAVMVGALAALHWGTPFELGRWYTFLVYVPLGALVYLGALVALREFTREDWDYVMDVLHPGQMWHYLRSELGTKRG